MRNGQFHRLAARRSRPHDSGATRQAILRAAERIFADEGLEGARTDAIAAAAGVNKALPPIGADVAMAWLVSPEQRESVASLCALAGFNWVRDRWTRRRSEPRRGDFAPANRYDESVRLQAAAGLPDAQVCHRSPTWANPNNKRFPLDLRDTRPPPGFGPPLADGGGRVRPWNEADIDEFGGHTGHPPAGALGRRQRRGDSLPHPADRAERAGPRARRETGQVEFAEAVAVMGGGSPVEPAKPAQPSRTTAKPPMPKRNLPSRPPPSRPPRQASPLPARRPTSC